MSAAPAHEIMTIIPSECQADESVKRLRQQCFDVRIEVFHHEQGFPLETELDEYDDNAIHFLLRLLPTLEPIGTIRCVKGKDQYKLSRLAVLKDYRKFRLGRELVLALHDFVSGDAKASGGEQSFARVVSHSQIPVKGFYAKFGYYSEGDEFDEDGAPHQRMVVHLPLTAASGKPS